MVFIRMWIVYCVMQSTAFLAFHSLSGNQVTYVNHITQFTDFAGSLDTFEQTFCFFV